MICSMLKGSLQRIERTVDGCQALSSYQTIHHTTSNIQQGHQEPARRTPPPFHPPAQGPCTSVVAALTCPVSPAGPPVSPAGGAAPVAAGPRSPGGGCSGSAVGGRASGGGVSIHAKEREAQGERGAECAESKSKQEKREKGPFSSQAARHALTSCFNLANSGSDASADA